VQNLAVSAFGAAQLGQFIGVKRVPPGRSCHQDRRGAGAASR